MRTMLLWLLPVLGCPWTALAAEPLRVVTRVKLEGVLVDRMDPAKAPIRVSEEYDPATSRGPLLALLPGGEIECVLGSSDPESILSKRLGVPAPPIEDLDLPVLKLLGFTQPEKRIEFFGVNNGELLVFDTYYVNGWLWLSGSGSKIRYVGSMTNPFVSAVVNQPAGSEGESYELEAPLYTWDFIQDTVAGNGDNRACSPPQGKAPESRFLVLVERGGCLFTQKAQNAAQAGAAGVVLYDSEMSEVFPLGFLVTPGAAVPSVLVRRADGLGLLKEIGDKGEGRTKITLRAANLLGSLSGSSKGDELTLNLVLTEASDYMFVGTVTGRVPQAGAAAKLPFLSAAENTLERPVLPHRKGTPLAQ